MRRHISPRLLLLSLAALAALAVDRLGGLDGHAPAFALGALALAFLSAPAPDVTDVPLQLAWPFDEDPDAIACPPLELGAEFVARNGDVLRRIEALYKHGPDGIGRWVVPEIRLYAHPGAGGVCETGGVKVWMPNGGTFPPGRDGSAVCYRLDVEDDDEAAGDLAVIDDVIDVYFDADNGYGDGFDDDDESERWTIDRAAREGVKV